MEKFKIPEGLYRCDKCGEYKGKVKAKDLNWDYYFDREKMEKSEEILSASCLCDGILCPKCKKNKIHRPISNSYDPETNTIEHWPYFTGMMGCRKCEEKINKELNTSKEDSRGVDMTGKDGITAFQLIGGPPLSRQKRVEKIKIFCDKCGKVAVTVSFYPEGEDKDYPRPALKISGWICNTTAYEFNEADLTKESLLRIATLLRQKKFKDLIRMDHDDIFGFFCHECGKNYCSNCWKDITPIFDGDFYDYTLATCPIGHRQEIND